MACETEQAAVTNASLALETSLLALEQALAVVESNTQALQAAQDQYTACINRMLAPQPHIMLAVGPPPKALNADDFKSLKVSRDLVKTAISRSRQVLK